MVPIGVSFGYRRPRLTTELDPLQYGNIKRDDRTDFNSLFNSDDTEI